MESFKLSQIKIKPIYCSLNELYEMNKKSFFFFFLQLITTVKNSYPHKYYEIINSTTDSESQRNMSTCFTKKRNNLFNIFLFSELIRQNFYFSQRSLIKILYYNYYFSTLKHHKIYLSSIKYQIFSYI